MVRGNQREERVAVAIDKDKGSHQALKWTVDRLLSRGQALTLLHVKQKPFSSPNSLTKVSSVSEMSGDEASSMAHKQHLDSQATKEFFLPFRCLCTRKDIQCNEVVLEDPEIAKTLINYCNQNWIDILVLGAPSKGGIVKSFREHNTSSSFPDTDISFVSRGRPSLERSFASPWSSNGDSLRPSNFSDMDNLNYLPPIFGMKSIDSASLNGFSSSSQETDSLSWSSNSLNMDDVETEMRRLKLELKQTMGMYNSTACKEAFTAEQKANEVHHWKQVEEQRFEEARSAGEAAMEMAEKEKEKSNVEIEAAETAQKTADLEVRKRASLEKMAEEDTDEAMKAMADFGPKDVEYRRYTFNDIQKATENFSNSLKIGEGGYGPVYRGELDNTSVAIKVLGPDATQGRSQFQQEVEVLSCIRHPNMVLLLGACPENGCLVYEYMANGSLEDCLFRKGGAPVLPWQLRFRIAAEIATGLLFLHQARPEPIVHRDLKPANILLDHNYVSKISDVGLARLIPPSVADSMTQYRMTATAGTFCYIDPEYQQTGMLGIKSDIYSLGVILLQILTSRSPMGLTHTVERSIEKGNFADILDPYVHDWPVEEAQKLAELSLQCLEMRKRDRPDLKKVVLPELDRLRALAEESMGFSTSMSIISASSSPYPSHGSSFQEITSPHHQVYSSSLWSGSTMSQSSSTSSYSGRRSYWME